MIIKIIKTSEYELPKNWSLIKIHEFCKNENLLFKFLQDRLLLKKERRCPNCGNFMKLEDRNGRCRLTIPTSLNRSKRKKVCDVKISLKEGTWFSKTKLSYEVVLKLTYMLVYNYDQCHIIRELELNKNTVLQWSHFVQQVMIDWLNNSSEMIGGEGRIVK